MAPFWLKYYKWAQSGLVAVYFICRMALALILTFAALNFRRLPSLISAEILSSKDEIVPLYKADPSDQGAFVLESLFPPRPFPGYCPP